MGEPVIEFSVYLVYEDVTFGVNLKKNISYNQLVAIVKKKFKLNDSCNIMFTYKVGTKCVHIVDDDDVKFFVNEICKGKGTPHTIVIKKIEQCFVENPSSSKSFGININVPLFPNDLNAQFNVYNDSQLPKKENFQPQNYLNPQYTMHYDAQLPKKEKCENHNDFIENDHYEHDWQMNTLKYIHKPPDPQPIIKTPTSQNEHGKCILKTGDKFDNKKECMRAIGRKALLDGYEFKPRKSDTLRYDVICVHPGCKWKIISSKCKYNSQWELGTVNDHHTCSKTTIGMYHRNASKNLLGHLLVPKFRDPNRIYKAKDIKNDINQEFNVDISYKQAWRSKNVALDTLEGCPKASFAQLPVFCHNLEMTNEGTVTHIDTDDEDHFKMVFIAFGVAIRSFLCHMRPLLIIDAAHLKGTYLGTNLLAVGMDGNNQIIPIATGVSQGETLESWTWFLSKLKECIGEDPRLTIISDRHVSVQSACQSVFPNAFHGHCCRHLMMNCNLKGKKIRALFWKMCKAYTPDEFNLALAELGGKRPDAYNKLIQAGVETWSRAYSAGNRYNYMTSNSAESINSLTRNVRRVPITNLMEWYNRLVQEWYCNRREKYKDSKLGELSDWATAKIQDRMIKSANWIVAGIFVNRMYEVNDHRKIHTVDLDERTCTCNKWQMSALPCGHVLAACRVMGMTDFNHLASDRFQKTELKATYMGLVFPVGEVSGWQCPNYLKVVKPPVMVKPQSGRPKNKDRVSSQGEEPVPVKCGRCGNLGHTRQSCRETLPKKKAKVSAKARSQEAQPQVYSQQPHAQFYSQQAEAHSYSQQGMPSSQEGQVYSQQIWPDGLEAVNLGDP